MNPLVQQFIADFYDGNQTAAAADLRVSQPTVSEWLRGVRPVPHASAADMERLSGGRILANKVRDDARWSRSKELHWPWHKDGRPVLDVTKAAA
jgi:DNA-binding transcriptional regulator YdaS (Cro superfamily)